MGLKGVDTTQPSRDVNTMCAAPELHEPSEASEV